MTIEQSSKIICDGCGYEASCVLEEGDINWPWYTLFFTLQPEDRDGPFHVCASCVGSLQNVLPWIGMDIRRDDPCEPMTAASSYRMQPLGTFSIDPLDPAFLITVRHDEKLGEWIVDEDSCHVLEDDGGNCSIQELQLQSLRATAEGLDLEKARAESLAA